VTAAGVSRWLLIDCGQAAIAPCCSRGYRSAAAASNAAERGRQADGLCSSERATAQNEGNRARRVENLKADHILNFNSMCHSHGRRWSRGGHELDGWTHGGSSNGRSRCCRWVWAQGASRWDRCSRVKGDDWPEPGSTLDCRGEGSSAATGNVAATAFVFINLGRRHGRVGPWGSDSAEERSSATGRGSGRMHLRAPCRSGGRGSAQGVEGASVGSQG
jgi:hypothetical protein